MSFKEAKYELESDNFNSYFDQAVAKMTEENKSLLPEDLMYRMFRKQGMAGCNYKLSFITKLFVLFKALKKRWFLVVMDEENGVTTDEFCTLLKEGGKDTTIAKAKELINSGSFVLADKDLAHSFGHLNNLGVTGGYKWAIDAKNAVSEYSKYRESASYMVNFLMNYEAQKKKIVKQKGLLMPELYMLYYLYDGQSKKGSDAYLKTFKYAFNSGRSQTIIALQKLSANKLIEKTSSRRFTEYRITALGIAELNDALDKFVFNF